MSTSTPRPWKRNLTLAASSALLVGLLFYYGLIDLSQVRTAFRDHAGLLALNVCFVLGLSVISIARHMWVLHVVGVYFPWGRVTAANLVSQAIGQWAPGSMAVSELVRMGLMLGDSPPESASRIAVASIVDRLIGLGMTFLVGAVASVVIVVQTGKQAALLLPLSAGCLLFGGLLIALPLVGGVTRFDAIALRLHMDGPTLYQRVRRTLAGVLSQIGAASAHWRGRHGAVAATMVMSAIASLCNAGSGYLTSMAINDEVPFLLLASVLPLTIISVILPIGFAGFGGPQLVAVALFAPFGVSPKTILALTLVQSTLVLAVQTALGLLFASVYARRISELLRGLLRRGASAR